MARGVAQSLSGARIAHPKDGLMVFRSVDKILTPDARFADLYVVENGGARRMGLADHRATIADVTLSGTAPQEVRKAFDLARNVLVYAYFDYDLLVVGEIQSFAAFELALKNRQNGHGGASKGTLRNLVDRARKIGIFSPKPPAGQEFSDPIEALFAFRNGLAHGTSEIHSPGMALTVLESCAHAIDVVYPLHPVAPTASDPASP
jgi:hypothetical protein